MIPDIRRGKSGKLSKKVFIENISIYKLFYKLKIVKRQEIKEKNCKNEKNNIQICQKFKNLQQSSSRLLQN